MASSKTDGNVLERVKDESKHQNPPMYNVILLNDDYTPFEFVIDIMKNVFGKSDEEAIMITVQIHEQGKGLCGVYVKDIAETKQLKVSRLAEKEGHPLKCIVEPESPAPRSPRM